MDYRLLVFIFISLLVSLALVGYWLRVMLRRSRRIEATGKESLELELEVFKTASQAVGGAVLILSLLFTWQTLQQNQESQITERFTRAIDQLGHDQTAVRVGGIYALGRIADDSKKDHRPVMEILTAYARNNFATYNREVEAKFAPPEIQAVASVIAKRRSQYDNENQRIDLQYVDLSGISVQDANLRRANLYGASLVNAHLVRANLSGADLTGGADLSNAVLENSNLRDAKLIAATLTKVDLRGSDLRGADLTGIKSLSNADLRGADLSTARGLLQGLIDRTRGDDKTKLPPDLSAEKMVGNQRDYELRRQHLSEYARTQEELRAEARPRVPSRDSGKSEIGVPATSPLERPSSIPHLHQDTGSAYKDMGRTREAPQVTAEPTLESVQDESRRRSAARVGLAVDLAKIGLANADSIPALIDELSVKDRFAREYAAEALARIGGAAVDPLIQAMEIRGDEISLADAATALGRIGPAARKAIPTLNKLRSHRFSAVRDAAESCTGGNWRH